MRDKDARNQERRRDELLGRSGMGPAEWVGADATTHVYVAGLVEAVFDAQSQDYRAKGEGYTRRDEIGQLGDIPRFAVGARCIPYTRRRFFIIITFLTTLICRFG